MVIWWQRGLRRESAAALLLGLQVRIPQAASMSVCFACYVLSGTGLWESPINRPVESCQRVCVCVCVCV